MWIDTVFFGFGSAQALGGATAEEPPRKESLRRLRSTSAAFCSAAERGPVHCGEPERPPMSFAIPKIDR